MLRRRCQNAAVSIGRGLRTRRTTSERREWRPFRSEYRMLLSSETSVVLWPSSRQRLSHQRFTAGSTSTRSHGAFQPSSLSRQTSRASKAPTTWTWCGLLRCMNKMQGILTRPSSPRPFIKSTRSQLLVWTCKRAMTLSRRGYSHRQNLSSVRSLSSNESYYICLSSCGYSICRGSRNKLMTTAHGGRERKSTAWPTPVMSLDALPSTRKKAMALVRIVRSWPSWWMIT